MIYIRRSILLSTILLIELVGALYEDQIGKFDWSKQFIGQAEQVYFSPLSRQIVVATNQNVLASLNLRNGNLVWRHVYEAEAKGKVDLLKGFNDEVLVVSGGGKLLRSWEISSGFLLWEVPIKLNQNENVLKSFYQIIPSTEQLVIVTLTNDFYVHVSMLNYTSETLDWTWSSLASWGSHPAHCEFMDEEQFVCVDQSTFTLHHLKFGPRAKFTPIPFQRFEKTDPSHKIEIVPVQGSPSKSNNLVGLRIGDNHLLVIVLDDGNVTLVQNLHNVIDFEVVESKTGTAMFYLMKEDGKMKLNLEDERGHRSLDVNIPQHFGEPTKMWIYEFARSDGDALYRVLYTTQDDGLTFCQLDGKPMWSREEALASIVTVAMVDLPVSDSDIQFQQEFRYEDVNVVSMMFKRLASQLYQLESSISSIIGGFHAREPLVESKDSAVTTRDVFNLHKIIVVVTVSGKTFGIDSSTGQIVWQRFIPDLKPFESEGSKKVFLFTQTTTAHFLQIPQCVVVAMNRRNNNGLLYQFHPITGEEISSGVVALDYSIAQATLLPQTDGNYLRGLLLLDTQGKIHIHPPSAAEVAVGLSSSLFLYTANPSSSSLTGYGLHVVPSVKMGVIAVPVWKINLSSSQVITKVVTKQPSEHVHSQGRVMGDRSVMYKYLNPNLIAIVTEGNDKQQKASFSVFLVDVVTGNIVFSVSHKRSRGPIHLVLSENWVMYAYYSEKSRRTEISVLELYEGKIQSNTTAFSSLNPPRLPMVERQAYVFPPGLDTMSVTMTEKGITSKHLLLSLPNGGILELPKSLLDPRRAVFATPEHREESIYPYIPELPIPAESIINYNKSIFRIRHIDTAPAGLESTCLVFAYGLDLFFARVTPSRTFDVLKDDFDHYLISAVLLALVFAAYISRHLAARKALHQAWK